MQALKAHSLKRASKNFHTTHGCQEQDTWSVLPEMVAFKDPLTLDIGYLSSLESAFVIEIQAHARRIGSSTNLLKQDEN